VLFQSINVVMGVEEKRITKIFTAYIQSKNVGAKFNGITNILTNHQDCLT